VAQALTDAMREDPDVLMVTEMRDPETMRLTLNAAETGHLVLATMHSGSCAEAVQRMVSAFPAEIQGALASNGLLSKTQYDEHIEWTWYYLWHHEGRRARMGASMMAPDYTQWHGMFEVAERFYMGLIPQAREITAAAARGGRTAPARAVDAVIDSILNRPEHQWIVKGAEEQADAIAREMQRRYGQSRQER
jgi:hypothetical protein